MGENISCHIKKALWFFLALESGGALVLDHGGDGTLVLELGEPAVLPLSWESWERFLAGGPDAKLEILFDLGRRGDPSRGEPVSHPGRGVSTQPA